MAIEVTTKDCAGLDDVELAEMADLTASTVSWEVGQLGKQAEEWVLISQASEDGSLAGFMFTTLERIGGTPALVVGLASISRSCSNSAVLGALMDEQYHKALMAFPDEDVLVSVRLTQPDGFEALGRLQDVRPSLEEKANGEERAWGRRLSKRYGAFAFDDRSMIAKGDGENLVLDHDAAEVASGAEVFADCDTEGGQYVIAWGWAMAEFLEGYVATS